MAALATVSRVPRSSNNGPKLTIATKLYIAISEGSFTISAQGQPDEANKQATTLDSNARCVEMVFVVFRESRTVVGVTKECTRRRS